MNSHHPPKVKWLPTEEDKKDCHRCRNGWSLIKSDLGYRVHWNGPDSVVTCHAKGPLVLAPPPPKRDYTAVRRRLAERFGYFLVGDVAIAIVVGVVWLALRGFYAVVAMLPGGWDQALHVARIGAVDATIGISAIYGATAAGEFLWKTFKKTPSPVEPTI